MNEGFKTNNKPPYVIDNPGIFHCGDIMYDNSLYFSKIAEQNSNILVDNNLDSDNFVLATIHRDNNTDNSERLEAIFKAILYISETENIKFIIPLHPRTSNILKKQLSDELYNKILQNKLINITHPISFLDMILLEQNAKIILTDSGGVQKEAFFFKKPSIILRPQTEWTELTKSDTAIIADADTNKIIKAYKYFKNKKNVHFPLIFGNGNASQFICEKIIENFDK
jgi:UDP-GlcNAc3NAcA epimerase